MKSAKSPKARSRRTNAIRSNVAAIKRDMILGAATELFYETGYRGTNLDDIAATLSVTKAVIYYEFGSKGKLLEELLFRNISLAEEAMSTANTHAGPAPEKLAIMAIRYAAMIIRHQKMFAIFWREIGNLEAAPRRKIGLAQRRLDDIVSAVLEAGRTAGAFRYTDARLTARMILGALTFSYTWYRPGKRLPPSDICRLSAECALNLAGYRGKALPLDRWIADTDLAGLE